MKQSKGQQQQYQGGEARRRVRPRRERERSFQWLVWTLVGLASAVSLVFVVLAVGGVFKQQSPPPEQTQTYALTPQQMAQLASTGQSMGSPSAKVTILEFSDFQ